MDEGALLEFEARLGRALQRVRLVLEAEKAVSFPSERQHCYEDKYLLAEHLTRSAAAAQLSGLATLGPDAAQIQALQGWAAQGRPVLLRFRSEERCSHLRTETRDVEGAQGTEVSVGGAVQALLSCRAVTKVTEHVWKFEVSYSLEASSGVGEDAQSLRLLQRGGSAELRSASEAPPRLNAIPAIDKEVDASWLFRQFQADPRRAAFRVDRSRPECRTPRRNPDVREAEEYFTRLERWAESAASYLDGLLQVQPGAGREAALKAARRPPLVLAVAPLLLEEEDAARAEAAVETGGEEAFGALVRIEDTGGPLLGPDDSARLLQEELRLLREQQAGAGQSFPAGDALATAAETTAALAFRHCSEVCRQWRAALDYLEKLLRKQLAAAIGKDLAPVDFAEYMAFHNRRLFDAAYAPVPFAYAVRRSEEHSPEGSLSVECEGADGVLAPIGTLVAKAESPHPMHFALSASTSVRFGGRRFLHAWLDHKFSDQAGTKLTLAARARQFSSMMVLVGRIASATLFEPTFAAIVKDKDALSIPLQLSTIPTPKEFRDAVESLSPEQRAFATAFRALQLESTLFGVLVVQVKPQLEKVLNLPVDSLTKEIGLSRDLMRLFMEYQIPSDLLSFDAARAGSGDTSTAERLEAVRGQVQGMQAVIEQAEREELESKRAELLAASAAAARGPSQERFRTMTTIGCDFTFRNRRAQASASPPAPSLPLAPSAPSAAPVVPEPRAQQQPRLPADEAPTGSAGPLLDYTEVPRLLDQRAEALDSESALRPTIISAGAQWRRTSQKGLLAEPGTEMLGPKEQKGLKDAAFDLLDALTKSGALELADAELHVIVAATHCFEKSLLETVVQDNVDPIERVERSTLILATTIHRKPAAALLRPAQLPRARRAAPALFPQEEGA